MEDGKDEEVVESKKLTKKDKQEIQEGACVNCMIAALILMFLSALTLFL